MAYEKQTWETGDIVTAEKLNHMENGIGNIVICTPNLETNAMDCPITNKELYELCQESNVWIQFHVEIDRGRGEIYKSTGSGLICSATISEEYYEEELLSKTYTFRTVDFSSEVDGDDEYPAFY